MEKTNLGPSGEDPKKNEQPNDGQRRDPNSGFILPDEIGGHKLPDNFRYQDMRTWPKALHRPNKLVDEWHLAQARAAREAGGNPGKQQHIGDPNDQPVKSSDLRPSSTNNPLGLPKLEQEPDGIGEGIEAIQQWIGDKNVAVTITPQEVTISETVYRSPVIKIAPQDPAPVAD